MADPITGMDILSDAVKIGLGALIGGGFAVVVAAISGVVTYIVARQNHKTELAKLETEHRNMIGKMEFERRSKILAECADVADRLSTKSVFYLSWVKKLCGGSIRLEDRAELKKRSQAIVDVSIEFKKLLVELTLLGEDDCVKAFTKFFSTVSTIQARGKEATDGGGAKELDEVELSEMLLKMNTAQYEFIGKLKNAYKGCA